MMRSEEERQLLCGLIQRYSPSGREAEAADYLLHWLDVPGIRTYVDEAHNAVASWGDGEETICILGHIDTVPGELPVSETETCLAGRGAVDAKGPLAAAASALLRLAGVHHPPSNGKILLIGAADEEGSSSGANYLLRTIESVPSHLIIAEPSRPDRITLGYRGCIHGTYRVESRCAHTASEHPGACDQIHANWNEVVRFAAEHNTRKDGKPRSPFYRLDPGLRRLASEYNGSTEKAEIDFEVRIPPAVPAQKMQQHLFDRLPGNLHITSAADAYISDRNTQVVRAFLRAIRDHGRTPGFSLKTGTSDMNVVAPHWRIPALAYGPGNPELSHTNDERVQWEEYETAIDVLSSSLATLLASL